MPITINGTGTITGISVGGLPDAIITQPEMATGVAGTGPAFRACLTGDQVVTTSVTTKLSLSTEIFDTAGRFNNTGSTVGGIPAYAFLPNVAGYYQFSSSIYASSTTGLTYNFSQIHKNGSMDSSTIYGPYSGLGNMGATSSLIYLNGTTDYVELYVQVAGTGTLTIGSPSPYTFFTGALVRAA
jgi:hypothetical protein